MKKGTTANAAPNKNPEIERLKKSDGRKNNGGARKGAGAPKKEDKEIYQNLTEKIEKHADEEVEVQILDKKTNTARVEKKSRALAILDMLYNEAIGKRSIPAAKEYFDRTRGRARQSVEFSGEIKTDKQTEPSKAELAAAAAYEQAD